MLSALHKQIGTVKNLRLLGERCNLVLCNHCSSLFIGNETQRSHRNINGNTAQTSSHFGQHALQEEKPSRLTYFERPKYPLKYVNSVYNNCSVPTSYSVLLNSRLSTQSCLYQYRLLHLSSIRRKEESKVEKTVKALKESSKDVAAAEEGDLVPAKKSLLQRFVGVVKHYYHGFRLLFIDVRICSKLIWLILNGKTLTRREHNQLVRTTADLFRILPMLVFVIVPFAEFLLPVALKLFPNMLPSTFQDENEEREKTKKKLKAKIEMAKFLQKTIEETAVQGKRSGDQNVETFGLFLEQIRTEGSKPKTKDILKFAKLFENEITLDNLSRQQLRACCIVLGITPIGTDALLRFLLEMKLRKLYADDMMIQKEGVDSLTVKELQGANRARGMRALGVSEDRLKDQLKQWLQLHIVEQIPTSLLLLSRALYLSNTLSPEEKLGVTITKLADTAQNEAKAKVAEMSGEKVDNKTKLDIIKHEEQIIAAEREQQAKEDKIEEQAVRDRAEAKAAETVMAADPIAKPIEMSPDEVLKDTAPAIEVSAKESFKVEESQQEITSKELDELEEVLEEVVKTKKIDMEVEDLKSLKVEVTDYKEDLEDLKEVAVVSGADQKRFKESKSAKLLAKKVDKMIGSLDLVLNDLQDEKTRIQEKMSLEEECLKAQGTEEECSEEQMAKYKKNLISINELVTGVKRLKNISDDSKLKTIFEVLDTDKDGIIDVNDALRVLELLSHENLKLSAPQVEEISYMIKSESVLEEEEKKLEKVQKEEILKEKQGNQQQN